MRLRKGIGCNCATLVVVAFVCGCTALAIVFLTINFSYVKLHDQIISKSSYNFYNYTENCVKSNIDDKLCMTVFHDDIISSIINCSASSHPYKNNDICRVTTCEYQYTNRSLYTSDIGVYWKYNCGGEQWCSFVIKEKTNKMCNGTNEQIYNCKKQYYNNFRSKPIWCDLDNSCQYDIGVPLFQILYAILLILFELGIIYNICIKPSHLQESINQPIMIEEQENFV